MKYFLILLVVLGISAQAFAENPQVTMQITGSVTGTIVLELYPDKAPITVANFLSYCNTNFYDGLIFHRVIDGFMVQGGGFENTLVQKTPATSIANESYNGLLNLRGTVAMARTSDPHSATSHLLRFKNL